MQCPVFFCNHIANETMRELKSPLTLVEQIKKLEFHGLQISNPTAAMAYLAEMGYYSFTGYALQFRIDPASSTLQPGTSFEDVQAICEFDRSLRNIFFAALSSLEQFFRSVIAHDFSLIHCVSEPHDQHYATASYRLEDGVKILLRLTESKCSKKRYRQDAFWIHHSKNYGGFFPLWVLVHMMCFSDLYHYFKALLPDDQRKIAYDCGCGSKMLQSCLRGFSSLRNRCAHLARIYNSKPLPSIVLPTAAKQRNIRPESVFAYMLAIVCRLPTTDEKDHFLASISDLLTDSRYLSVKLDILGFPDDWKCLLEQTKGRPAPFLKSSQ